MISMPHLFPIYAGVFVLVVLAVWTGLEYIANWLDRVLPPSSTKRRLLALFIAAFRSRKALEEPPQGKPM